MQQKVTKHTVDDSVAGQRIDNYLFTRVKGVPKSRIYRAIRNGELRINGKRVKVHQRLEVGDEIRIPPLRQGEVPDVGTASDRCKANLENRILYEENGLIVLNKPAGMPVHGGSDVSLGVIEALRQMRPQAKLMELVHRLDKGTSGCLLIATKRSVLLHYQDLLRRSSMNKRYWLLVKGEWQEGQVRCQLPLTKNVLSSGERMVTVDRVNGKQAITIFKPIQQFAQMTLVEAILKTGRTHQIRVHAARLGYPIAGDDKYGDRDFNQIMRQQGLKRLFLHCVEMSCFKGDNCFGVCSPIDSDLMSCLSAVGH